MVVVYTTYAIMQKVVENQGTLVQANIEEMINEAEGKINALMLSSGADVTAQGFLNQFDTNKHMAIRDAANAYVAMKIISFNPNAQSSNTQVNMMLRMFYMFWAESVNLLSNPKFVNAIK